MASVPAVSLIVPTFNEAGNIDELLDGVCAALPAEWDVEVLFVDDSTDDTPEVIEKAAVRCPMPVSVLHRDEPEGASAGRWWPGSRGPAHRGSW